MYNNCIPLAKGLPCASFHILLYAVHVKEKWRFYTLRQKSHNLKYLTYMQISEKSLDAV